MQLVRDEKRLTSRAIGPLKVLLPTKNYRSMPIPGTDARLGTCFIRVIDLPASLERYMSINPRVPSRTAKGILTGPVAKGILSTLREQPAEMVLKNLGIYLLVDKAFYNHEEQQLQLSFSDPGRHGIVNGGHTYAAIMEAVESATPEDMVVLEKAYVRLNIYEGIEADLVPEIAEGQNRSKQVDDPSLANLQGDFDVIRKVLHGKPGAESVAYHQGDRGDIYISELLVILEMFNPLRFNHSKHPNALYNRQGLGLKYFAEDMENQPKMLKSLIKLLPDFLWLADSIRLETPAASNRQRLKFGRIKLKASGGSVDAKRAGSPGQGVYLPFLGLKTAYRVPNGWVYPMLASFRANLQIEDGGLGWKIPLPQLLKSTIDDLVAVCIAEHRDNHARPDLIGKRESAYSACYTRMELYLAKRGLVKAD